jgi:hypothetical protein
MKIYGFTLLRNGVKYDYPFLESLRSLCALCDQVFVALGQSDDGTEARLTEFKNLVIVPTVWDESMRKSGLILSQQTNIALDALREKTKDGWGLYLQADEVLNEKDFGLIRRDIEEADRTGCDAVSFRYLHFWQSYHQIAIAKRWYPQEIRAVKLDSAARSYGDAQSFESIKKRFESDAFVYHYGHVREASAYEKKKADFGRWWHQDEELKKVLQKGARRDKHEPTLPYFGPQPSFMKERIGASFMPAKKDKVVVFGLEQDLEPAVRAGLMADLEFTESVSGLLAAGAEKSVLLRPLPAWAFPLRWMGFGSRVPPKMKSPQAREWSHGFRAVLKFSEKGIYAQ